MDLKMKIKRPTLGLSALAGALMVGTPPSAAVAQQSPVAASVTVDPTRSGPVIERDVYGQFAEHLGRSIYEGVWVGPNSRIPNTRGYRNDVLAALKKVKVPVIRWPGGCFADEYNWRDGIGPRNKRPVRINTHWGWVPEKNEFGTHEFMNFTELVGAEAYVAGNMGSGTAREMGQWVEYMTSDLPTTLANERRANGRAKPWKVKYFGVGNESWGCGGNMRPEYSADLHKRFQTYVKAPPGTSIIKVATGANVDDYNFTEVLMQRLDPRFHVNAISLHYYTFPGSWENKGAATGFAEDKWVSTLKNALRMDELVSKHKAIMDKHDPQKKVALYVDEWGTWYDQEPGSKPGFLYQQNSLRDAHVAALTLNIFHRHTDRVKLAAIAQMVNVLQAMILTDGPRMVLTPTYHLFDMYVPFQGATPVAASATAPEYRLGDTVLPRIDVSAARDTSGRLHLALVNLDPNRPASVTTSIAGVRPTAARGRVLTGPGLDTHNTFDRPNNIQPVAFAGRVEGDKLVFDLPAKSVAVVAVD